MPLTEREHCKRQGKDRKAKMSLKYFNTEKRGCQMLKNFQIEIYAIVYLCTIIFTVAALWLVLYIRDRIQARRITEAAREQYIEKLEKERNFYRLQCQTRNILDAYKQTVEFE